MAAGPADQAAGGRGHLPDRALPAVAAGGIAVLPRPQRRPGTPTADPTSTNSLRVSAGMWSPRTSRSDWTGSARNWHWRSSTPCSVGATSTRRKTFPTVVMQVVRFLTTTTVTSLLDQAGKRLETADRPAGAEGREPAGAADLRQTQGRGPRRRRRLGRRVPARHLAPPPPGVPGSPGPELRRYPPAMAAGPGQTMGALATWDRPGIGRRPPGVARPDPVRPVL